MNDIIPDVNEEDGECLCDECGGRGCLPTEISDIQTMQSICWKCQGDGKLDWVSLATGKPKKKMLYGTSSTSFGVSGTSGASHLPWIQAAVKELTDKIDREIIESITTPMEQILNKHPII